MLKRLRNQEFASVPVGQAIGTLYKVAVPVPDATNDPTEEEMSDSVEEINDDLSMQSPIYQRAAENDDNLYS